MKLRHRVGIGTSIRMDPEIIVDGLGIESQGQLVWHYQANRGWQIAGVDCAGSFYVDCDEANHCVWVRR